MKLWVGLGNPGPEMSRNRHNIGFMAVDAIAERHGFSPWRQRFKGQTSEGHIEGRKILLLKPQTYMNLSGDSVQQAARFYKIPLNDITAFHDELDLAFGRLRIKSGGGAAGHNGLRSMDRCLSGPNYWRIRMGIGHPGQKERVTGHVLGDFSATERPILSDWLDAIAQAAPLLARDEPEAFMTKVSLLKNAN
ncbi:aminoacyl-tRNA hydrolase [Aristophania vespae]|uniref:Peptidyl-tRNA hydrolase n=1 Tax=Aristophania vespae TaxID=2697033 RepID=A0A6P1NBU5_9PROT|nr:aminoacyl-tRNA hydrolase [Aristophania vespae]QHI94949.1 aminoacyl-tRNA hydrolase [Aristophania vespae]UMM64112.1 Peptidyl-tRNA hydrolase [Aristophania vespae]